MSQITCFELGVYYNKMPYEKLEPYEGKLSRTVLRGGTDSNASLLPDQTLEHKQRFISQIMTSKSPVRSCEDIDETALSYAEIKALCAGDPRIKERMDLDVDVTRLRLLKADHQSKQFRLEDKLLKVYPQEMEQANAFIAGFQRDQQLVVAHPLPHEGFVGMEVHGTYYGEKDKAGAALLNACKALPPGQEMTVGQYRGFGTSLQYDSFNNKLYLILRGSMTHRMEMGESPTGNLTRMDNLLNLIPEKIEDQQAKLKNLHQQIAAAKEEIGKPFPQDTELKQKSARLAELDSLLNIDKPREAQEDKPPEKQSMQAKLQTPCRASSTTHSKSMEEVL